MNVGLRIIALSGFLVAVGTAELLAYPVAFALPLEKLGGEADVVVKAKVVATKPIDDPWFEKVHGYQPVETELRVISKIQGDDVPEKIFLRHYAPSESEFAHSYMPQWYRFDPDRTYILLADATDKPGVYRQIWKNHRSQEDQGQLLAADDSPHVGATLQQVYWHELTKLLTSEQTEDVKYAIDHLDRLSAGSYDNVNDFDRDKVLDALQPLVDYTDEEVSRQVIRVLGCSNPYLSPETSVFWLVTIGDGHLPGIGGLSNRPLNRGGHRYWKQLANVVDSDRPIETRALALRALGRADEPAVLELAQKWLKNDSPLIRAGAVVLLADFPREADRNLLTRLAKDPQSALRRSVAQAIGYGRMEDLIPLLGKLVDDADPSVSQAAAANLLSFAIAKSGDVVREKIEHPQFRPLFINALATEHPEAYLPELADNIRKLHEPENWWGGHVPWGVSFDILLRYAQQQTPAELQSTRLRPVLDALEYPAAKNEKGPSYYTSSQPRDLYALYLARGMTTRAATFRAQCKKTITYDIDYFFDMADKNPQQYLP